MKIKDIIEQQGRSISFEFFPPKSLEEMSPEVRVSEETRLKAKASVDRMLEIGRAEKTASRR
jgi:5,10-methylenetetrahydrofolate reductase